MAKWFITLDRAASDKVINRPERSLVEATNTLERILRKTCRREKVADGHYRFDGLHTIRRHDD